MTRKTLVVGALMLAMGGGALALQAGEGSQENGKHAACPIHVSGAKVNVVNIDSGVVIHVTAGDAATVARIQAAAAGPGAGESAHSGCKHCGAAGASPPPAESSSCTHGDSCGDAKAAVYACSMGDYSGPLTKDGRCPKCGMALSRKK